MGAGVNAISYTKAADEWMAGKGFHPSGVGDIAESERIRERDQLERRRAATLNAGAESGISGMESKLASLKGTSEELAHSQWLNNFTPTPRKSNAGTSWPPASTRPPSIASIESST